MILYGLLQRHSTCTISQDPFPFSLFQLFFFCLLFLLLFKFKLEKRILVKTEPITLENIWSSSLSSSTLKCQFPEEGEKEKEEQKERKKKEN
jgi:hypothetical protein